MEKTIFENYLKDLIYLLKENALEAVGNTKKLAKKEDLEFSQGYSTAYYEVISLLQNQAQAFNIPLEELGLDDINPDKDLL